MEILRRYRILFYALGIVVLLGSWEVFTLKYFSADGKDYAKELELRNTYQDRELSLSRSLHELYPNDPDAVFLQGLQQAHSRNDFLTGCRYYLKAARTGVVHNEDLLYTVIDCLVRQQAEEELLQEAVSAWRRNYPHSHRPLKLRFAGFAGRGNPSQTAARAIGASRVLEVLGCEERRDSGGLPVLDVYLQVNGPKLDVNSARQLLLEAGFQSLPAPISP